MTATGQAPRAHAFGRLWAADAISTAGDGFTLVAGPLLVLTLTRTAALVGGIVAAQYVPWLLFGLVSGTVVDRVDPRRLIGGVDTVRALLMLVLALAVWTGRDTVALVYGVFFLSGCGDTLTANATLATLPRVVERTRLTRANSRLLATRLVGGSLLARPVGAWLFGYGAAVPFAVDAASFLAGVVLVAGLPLRAPARPEPAAAEAAELSTSARVRAGLHALWQDPVLRVLGSCILVMNVTLAATTSVLVLLCRDRLGVGATGYGLLLATIAAGGLAGTAVVRPLLGRFGPAPLLTVGLVIEAGTQLGLALTTSVWVAGAVLLVFGVHGAVWSVLTLTLRQQRIAADMLGRTNAAYQVLSYGGVAVGGALGGVMVDLAGITAPMWFGFTVIAVLFVAAVPALRRSGAAISQ